MTETSTNTAQAIKLVNDLELMRKQGFNNRNSIMKDVFHKDAKALLALIANDLGYSPSEYNLWSNKGGSAASGEITLHADDLYIQISVSPYDRPVMNVLYRSCKGRNDYVGGSNNWMAIADLADYGKALQRFDVIRTKSKPENKELFNALSQFIGTEHHYRHSLFRNFLYTDGVKFLAGEAGAYWLIDLIAGFQNDKRLKADWENLEEFQLWILKVNPDKSAVLVCENGNGNQVLEHFLDYTDFPHPGISLYFEHNVLLLPSEH